MSAQPRVAIVTGAARGIGAAIARRLAADGLAIGVLDLDEDHCGDVVLSITEAGGRAVALGADVSDEAAVTAAVERCASTLGPPLVLVNNAGITRDNLLFRMSADDWLAVMDVHLKGAFLLSRAVQAHMTQHNWGRIVNISSLSALGNRGQANYSAAKSGLHGFTKTVALELGRFGVTANCIAPGYIATDMLARTAERLGITFDELVERTVPEIPVGRMGTPDDIAAAASFFVSEQSSFVTGQVLFVAGGPAA
jgi:3-oxoacyl-[acyl-carrier protein] reductase